MAQPSPSFFACSDPATNVDLPEDMPQPILKTSASASPSGQRKYTTFSDLLVESPDRSSARQQSNPADPPSGWQLPSSDGNRALKTSKRPDETRVNGRRDAAKKAKEEKGKLSMWKLMALTVSMGGSQVRDKNDEANNRLLGRCRYPRERCQDLDSPQRARLRQSVPHIARLVEGADIPRLACRTIIRPHRSAAHRRSVRLVSIEI